ncbi:hypothetical protein LTR85_004277 [Meristemomyces frigidus]|nr:hypothetical protein LTR85_004277 [Meristemomyces frigidus]
MSEHGQDKQLAAYNPPEYTRLVVNLKRAGTTDLREILDEFNSLLSGDLAKWADQDHRVKELLKDDYEATADDVKTVKDAFIEHWYDEEEETPDVIADIQNLKQKGEESLRQYYNRAAAMFRTAGGEDSPEPATQALRSLSKLATRAFKKGLHQEELRTRMMRLADPDNGKVRTLLSTYEKAEASMRLIRDEQQMAENSKKEKEFETLKAYIAATNPSAALLEQARPPPARTQSEAEQPQGARFATAAAPLNPPPAQFSAPAPGILDRTRDIPSDLSAMNLWQLASDSAKQKYPTFEPRHSPNIYISRSSSYRYRPDNQLCVRCGTTGHIARECTHAELTDPEQTFLWELTRFQREKGLAIKAARDASAPAFMASNLISASVTTNSKVAKVRDESDSEEEYKWQEILCPWDSTKAGDSTVTVLETEAGSSKRARPNGEEDQEEAPRCEHQISGGPTCISGNCEHPCCKLPAPRAKKPLKRTTGSRQKKPLKPITAMITEPPVDVRKILKQLTVVMPVTHLTQLSPYFRDEAKRLLAMPRQRRTKKGKENVTDVGLLQISRTQRVDVKQVRTELLDSIKKWSKKDRSHRAFSLPAKVWKDNQGKAVNVPRNHVAADQGSDINLIYPKL